MSLRLLGLSFALVCASSLRVSSADACGVSGPDGISACSLAEHEEETRPRWHADASGLFTSTALRFNGSLRAGETRLAALAFLSYAPIARVSIQAGAGAALGGRLSLPDGPHEFSVGPTAAMGVSWHIVQGRPFLVVSAQLTYSHATTELDGIGPPTPYNAFDLRGGAVFGTTLFNVISPYVLARGFGGPVYWRYQGVAQTGTDIHHYQFGAGIAARLAKQVDLYAEGVPLGEVAVAAGVGFAF